MSTGELDFGGSKALIGIIILIIIVAIGDTAFGAARYSKDTVNSADSGANDKHFVLQAQSLREWGKDADRRGGRARMNSMRPQVLEHFRSIARQISTGNYASAKSALQTVEKTTLRKIEQIALHTAYAYLFHQQGKYELSLERYRSALKLGKSLSQFKGAARHMVYKLKQKTANPLLATVEEKERAKKSVEIASRQKPRLRFRGDNESNGLAVIGFSITGKGATEDVYVLYSLPPGRIERMAVKAISRAKYDPVLIEGEPVRVEDMVMLISFKSAY